MTTLTSTIPGALSALETHMQNVASAHPLLNISVHVGIPIAEVENNYLAIGTYETGELVLDYEQDWAGFPAAAERKSERYKIPCTVRAWAGNTDPISRITDLFTMLDGILAELQADPQATVNGGYPLTPSGSWQISRVDIPVSGPLNNKGWGIVASFEVDVINVRLTF